MDFLSLTFPPQSLSALTWQWVGSSCHLYNHLTDLIPNIYLATLFNFLQTGWNGTFDGVEALLYALLYGLTHKLPATLSHTKALIEVWAGEHSYLRLHSVQQ